MPASTQPASRVLLLTDPAMAAHQSPGHPERPERMDAVEAGVADGARRAGAELVREPALPAADGDLLRVHPRWYLRRLEDAAAEGGGWLDPDTYLAPGSMHAARLAAGATGRAALAAASGDAQVAFAVVRPPGHHAATERATGFCLVNNVAVAVERLRADAAARRVAVVDWDVHHGDGTQEIYDADADLWYGSTHQSPLYPGTGDDAFTAAWLDTLLPAMEDFGPEAVIVSAGYDAHRDDQLAHLRVTDAGFHAVGHGLGASAARLGIAGVALALEGGYDLDALRASSAATVIGLLDGLRRGRS